MVIHKEGVVAVEPIALQHARKYGGVGFSGPVVRSGEHVLAKQRDQVRSDLLEVLTDQHSVIGQKSDLAVLRRMRDSVGDVGAEFHRGLTNIDPGLAGDGGTKCVIDQSKVFIASVGIPRLRFPLTIVMPPPRTQVMKVVAGELCEGLHSDAPVVVIEDVVHVKDKKHDGPSLRPRVQAHSRTTLGCVGAVIIDSSDSLAWEEGQRVAVEALMRGQSIIMPTDTVYGIACDAFSPDAVNTLLAHKGRGRHMPPPVLVASADDASTLARSIPAGVDLLMQEFWPGGVTVIVEASPEVEWDLGDTGGTVAIRMPDHPVALELLRATGPLAVSSANLTGQHSAVTVAEAYEQFGDALSVYIDAGPVGQAYADARGNPGSTIVDASGLDSGGPWRVVRHGVVPYQDIQAVTGGVWEQ